MNENRKFDIRGYFEMSMFEISRVSFMENSMG